MIIEKLRWNEIFGNTHISTDIVKHTEIVLNCFLEVLELNKELGNKYIILECPVLSLKIFLNKVISFLQEKITFSNSLSTSSNGTAEVEGADLADLFASDPEENYIDRANPASKADQRFIQYELGMLGIF